MKNCYDLDTVMWMSMNTGTTMTWTEEQVLAAYDADPYDADTLHWCQVMLAGLLGSLDEAKKKYPEMWI